MKTVDIVIPLYNEAKRIHLVLGELLSAPKFKGLSINKIIFVDDGSTDNTVNIIETRQNQIEKKLHAKVVIIKTPVNKGKVHAVRVGMQSSSADYTLMLDADLSTSLTELKKFLPCINKDIPVIIGTRKNGHSTVIKHQPLYREIFGRGYTLLTQLILNTWVTDFTCGFKAFSKEAREAIFSSAIIDRWSFDAETLFLATRYHFQIQEVAVVWNDRMGSKVSLIADIGRSFFDLLRIRLSHTETVPHYTAATTVRL